MEHPLTGLKKRLTIANIINDISAAFFCFTAIHIRVEIKHCEDTANALMNSAQNADAESFLGGYQAIGGLFGAGSMAFVTGMLELAFIVCMFYLLLFLAAAISGHLTSFHLKKDLCLHVAWKKLKRNAIFKCIFSLLLILPAAYFAFSLEQPLILLILLPQTIVLALCIHIIILLFQNQPPQY